MRAYLFLLLLSLLLLTPAYVTFRRKMRTIKREVFGLNSVNYEQRRDFVKEGPGQEIKIGGVPFTYVVILIFILWGAAVTHYVMTTMMG